MRSAHSAIPVSFLGIRLGAGNLPRAIEIYSRLIDQVLASKPKPETNLGDATDLSHLYASLATFERGAGNGDRAATLDQSRVQLWERWTRRLPTNAFVRRQLAAAPAR